MTLTQARSLVESYGGRLSGSRAYGRPSPDSDWDYWMPERQVKRLLRDLIARGVRWDSPFLGSVTFWAEGEQVEVSFLFPRNAKEAAKAPQGKARASRMLGIDLCI